MKKILLISLVLMSGVVYAQVTPPRPTTSTITLTGDVTGSGTSGIVTTFKSSPTFVGTVTAPTVSITTSGVATYSLAPSDSSNSIPNTWWIKRHLASIPSLNISNSNLTFAASYTTTVGTAYKWTLKGGAYERWGEGATAGTSAEVVKNSNGDLIRETINDRSTVFYRKVNLTPTSGSVSVLDFTRVGSTTVALAMGVDAADEGYIKAQNGSGLTISNGLSNSAYTYYDVGSGRMYNGVSTNAFQGYRFGGTAYHIMYKGYVGFGVGEPSAVGNIALEVASTTGAMLPPRMTAAQASAISLTSLDGGIIYVTDTNGTFTSVGFWGLVAGTWTALHL